MDLEDIEYERSKNELESRRTPAGKPKLQKQNLID